MRTILLCFLCWRRYFFCPADRSLIGVQLLPDEIEIGLEFRRISAVQGVSESRSNMRGMVCLMVAGARQDDDSVSQRDCLRQVMGHQKGGLLLLPEDLADVIAHIQPSLIIQGGERLIQKQKVRFQNQRPNESGPLAHAAGEFGRAGILKLAQA
mgnify:CR=1 FL=1